MNEGQMKTIGLIGGMSWESSIEYYRIINEATHEALGGLHNALSVMYTIDFHVLETLQHENRWDEADELMVDAARRLEKAGADFIVICANTMHKSAPAIQSAVNLPVLHIADATARVVKNDGIKKIGLLGTRYTMEQDFYTSRLIDGFGLEVVLPTKAERDEIHRVIFEELVVGKVLPESKKTYLKVIRSLEERGAEGVILGCTEIGLLVNQADTSTPLYDTTLIHARAAVEMALT
jgi:aspartate racemase